MNRRLALLALGLASFGALSAPASASGAGETLDPRLIGSWVHEKMINSGGASFASFSTVRTLQFDASGRVTQWVRSAGGGQNWSYGGGGRRLEFSGRWYVRDGVILVQPDAGGGFVEAGRYRFSSPYLVTESREGRLIWQRG